MSLLRLHRQLCHITHKKKFAKFLEHLATALGLVSSLFMCYFFHFLRNDLFMQVLVSISLTITLANVMLDLEDNIVAASSETARVTHAFLEFAAFG